MPLNTVQLAFEIEAVFNKVSDVNIKPADARKQMAQELAACFENYVKSGTVSTTVTGTCATPSGAGTIAGNGTGTIS